MILDVGLPDGDGRDLCIRLRKQGQKMPIIMLTGSDAETDVVRGLDSGANDYIAKPFRLDELLARLRAQLRIFENSEDAVFTIGPYTFRPSAKLLQDPVKNSRIRLTEKEAAILKFLYRAGTRAGGAAGAAERGLGLQRRGNDPHAGDAHLPAAPEDRARSGECAPAGHRGRRLSLDPEGFPPASWRLIPANHSAIVRRSATKARYSRAFAASSGTRSRYDGCTVTQPRCHPAVRSAGRVRG